MPLYPCLKHFVCYRTRVIYILNIYYRFNRSTLLSWSIEPVYYTVGVLNALSRQHSEDEIVKETFPDILKAISFTSSASVQDTPMIDSVSISGAEENVIPQSLLRVTALTSQDWRHAHLTDQEISFIVSCISRGHRPDAQQVMDAGVDSRFLKHWKSLVVTDGILLRRSTIDGQEELQMVIPQSLRELVFCAYHDDLGHQGRDRTLSLMKQRVYWPGMYTFVKEHIRTC